MKHKKRKILERLNPVQIGNLWPYKVIKICADTYLKRMRHAIDPHVKLLRFESTIFLKLGNISKIHFQAIMSTNLNRCEWGFSCLCRTT